MQKERLRMCIVCREHSDKKELLRIVKNKEGQIFVDKQGKANGRGAYICKSKECLNKLKKSRGLNRAFKCEVGDDVYSMIGEEIERT